MFARVNEVTYGPAIESKIEEARLCLERHGSTNIVLLSGVAGTGKTLIALAAAQRFTGHPLLVKQIQFHQGYSYEDFIEGLRADASGGFRVEPGVFLGWNDVADQDPSNRYVLLIEEFTRANISAVIGELMTYFEYRDRSFDLPISRRRVKVAPNLAIVATMNPRDRTALEVDDALIRRLRLIDCPPDTDQLAEMLAESLPNQGKDSQGAEIISKLVELFRACEREHKDTYREMMPFGHGMFAAVRSEDDLRLLWEQRIRYLLRRPLIMPHPFTQTIEDNYPWKAPAVQNQRASATQVAPDVAQAPSESTVSKTPKAPTDSSA
jgi:5-methylcytosine-specific restriction protein B